jgi:hypothetical protein
MANKKISDLTPVFSVQLSDYVPIIRSVAGVWTNFKVTLGYMLVSLGLLKGEAGIINVITSDTITFVGTWTYYHLIITCRKTLGGDEAVGYSVSSRSATGFTITPLEEAWIEWTIVETGAPV